MFINTFRLFKILEHVVKYYNFRTPCIIARDSLKSDGAKGSGTNIATLVKVLQHILPTSHCKMPLLNKTLVLI